MDGYEHRAPTTEADLAKIGPLDGPPWCIGAGNFGASHTRWEDAWREAWNWWVNADYPSIDGPEEEPPPMPADIDYANEMLRAHHEEQARSRGGEWPEWAVVTIAKHGDDMELPRGYLGTSETAEADRKRAMAESKT